MTEPGQVDSPVRGKPRRPPGLGIGPALLVTIVSVVVCVVSTVALVRREISTGFAELLAVVVLVSFGFAVYGLLRMVLALIETAGERRRHARAVTERRKQERTETPGSSP